MIAGYLTETVILLKPVVSIDDYGAEVTEWSEEAVTRAEVQWKSGTTVTQNDERFENRRVDVLVRWRTDVEATWRVSHNGILYNIDAVEPNRTSHLVRLICVKVNE